MQSSFFVTQEAQSSGSRCTAYVCFEERNRALLLTLTSSNGSVTYLGFVSNLEQIPGYSDGHV